MKGKTAKPVQEFMMSSVNATAAMTPSETFLTSKYPFSHPLFSNDFLLKHGNFFTKPTLHPDGYPIYPVLGEAPGYRIYPDLKSENPDSPLNFVIKQEKPPTPSSSPTDIDVKDETQILNGHSKNGTWISGKQKLSWDNSTVASYNPDTKMFRCVVCNAVGFLSRIAEHYLGTHTSAKVFQCLHCPYSSTWSRCVRMHMAKHHGVPNAPPSLWKGQPLLEEIFQLLTNLKTTVDSQGRERLDPEVCDKKFVCPKCPYTTDRRDLYLRHENIHKEDKPYHCYICFKLFNRADHVKKHFLRIHRGHPYDISLVRRRPPRVQSSVNGNDNQSGLSSFSVDKLISSNNDAKSDNEVIDLSNHDLPAGETTNAKQLKTFQCPYCSWEGVDSWCLRRHMNVHLKSFECPICEFKAGKAERLFTHVYRAHRKLVCTKCKFITDFAQDFDVHIKECCLEIIVGNIFDKTSEDSLNESDDGSLEMKINTPALPDLPSSKPGVLPDSVKVYDRPVTLDLKGSVSLMPLHNSISYCYPGSQRFTPESVNGLNGFTEEMMVSVQQDPKQSLTGSSNCKVEVKSELASPVQSSSDSGVADVISDNNDQDIACWHCGCEFADQSSLLTHTELYHRDDLRDPSKNSEEATPTNKTKKFSCAICNFNSDRQRTIIEHMRFHTGEVLSCRAGPPCAFTTVCDSTLEKHVESEHCDDLKRCPHCAFHATDKVTFIRHYRKCHHSKSCLRCRDIKRSFDKTRSGRSFEAILRNGEDGPASEVVRPYLHHNPYSKKAANAISPYSHCNAAMSKVAVAIPESLQTSVDNSIIPAVSANREHKPRKQSMPRKLLPVAPAVRPRDTVCDNDKKVSGKKAKTSAVKRRRKLLKRLAVKRCRLGHVEPFCFKSNVSYVRHIYWFHLTKKSMCYKCGISFKHLYQVLIHKRRHHENVIKS